MDKQEYSTGNCDNHNGKAYEKECVYMNIYKVCIYTYI